MKNKSKDGNDKIEIFSISDNKIKFLGEMFSNDTSRQILILLIKKEMTTSEISEKTQLSFSLVIHHLNKMIQVSIVEVSRIGKNTKNHDVKFYSAKPGILILPENASQKAKESKSFSKSLKSIMKFAVIGIVSIASYVLTQPPPSDELLFASGDEINLTWPLLVIIFGLIIERIITELKKRKKVH